jgi:hypothetical protein
MDRTLLVGTVKNPFLITALIFAGLYLLVERTSPEPEAPRPSGSWILRPPDPELPDPAPDGAPVPAERKG